MGVEIEIEEGLFGGPAPTTTYEMAYTVSNTHRPAPFMPLDWIAEVLFLLEVSTGGNIASFDFWYTFSPNGGGPGPARPWATTVWNNRAITAGPHMTVGIDTIALQTPVQLAVGVETFFYVPFGVGGVGENLVLVTPAAWPVLNTAAAFNNNAQPVDFRFIQNIPANSNLSAAFGWPGLSTTSRIYLSNNNGVNFINTGPDDNATRMTEVSGVTYYCCGNRLKTSNDGGTTIAQDVLTNAGDNWTDVCGTSALIVACGDGVNKIAFSTDIGATWTFPVVPVGWNPLNPRLALGFTVVGAPASFIITVIDQAPGTNHVLVNPDCITPAAFSIVALPSPGLVKWSAIMHIFEQPLAGPTAWDQFVIAGNVGGNKKLVCCKGPNATNPVSWTLLNLTDPLILP